MAYEATASIVGKVIKAPETRSTDKSTVTSFSVAVPTTRKAKDSQYYESDFYIVSVFGAYGESIATHIVPGKTKVFASGSLRQDVWQGRDGRKNTNVVINATTLSIVSDGNYEERRSPEEKTQEAVKQIQKEEESADENDLPF